MGHYSLKAVVMQCHIAVVRLCSIVLSWTSSRAAPSRAKPSRAEPSRAEPSRAEPSRAEPNQPNRFQWETYSAHPARSACGYTHVQCQYPCHLRVAGHRAADGSDCGAAASTDLSDREGARPVLGSHLHLLNARPICIDAYPMLSLGGVEGAQLVAVVLATKSRRLDAGSRGQGQSAHFQAIVVGGSPRAMWPCNSRTMCGMKLCTR